MSTDTHPTPLVSARNKRKNHRRFSLEVEHVGSDDRAIVDLRQAIKRLVRSYSLRVIRIAEAQNAAEGSVGQGGGSEYGG